MQVRCLLVLLFVTAPCWAQPAPPRPAARLNGESVPAAEVDREVRQAYGDRKFSDAEHERLRKAALAQVIDRRLVMAYLAGSGQAASGQDVDFAVSQFEKDLQSQNQTLAQHLKEVGLSADEFRRALAWQLSWKRYLDRHLTDENLEKYFERYRREFDGSQLRVAQILLKLPEGAEEKAIAAAKDRAAKLKAEIAAGQLSFAAAAKQHSQAPSSTTGGDI